jgi:hypothetical protein
MELSGWVKSRRGLLSHVRDGHLLPEYAWAFVILRDKADAGTAKGEINAPLLAHWMGPRCSQDKARRILRFLHKKRYIWYRAANTTEAQPYYVNKFELTKGPKTGFITDLSQLSTNKKVSEDDVLLRARPVHDLSTTRARPVHEFSTTGEQLVHDPSTTDVRVVHDLSTSSAHKYKKREEDGRILREKETEETTSPVPSNQAHEPSSEAVSVQPLNQSQGGALPDHSMESHMIKNSWEGALFLSRMIYKLLQRDASDADVSRGAVALKKEIEMTPDHKANYETLRLQVAYAVEGSKGYPMPDKQRPGETFTWHSALSNPRVSDPVALFVAKLEYIADGTNVWLADSKREQEHVAMGGISQESIDRQAAIFAAAVK